MSIIDIHPHVIAADTARYPLAPLGGTVSGWAASRPVTTEQLLALMDANGVDKAVLVQASTAYGYDNSYVADSSAAHPDRLLAVGCFDPLAADAPDRLAYWVQERGLVGARLFTTGSTMPDQADWLCSPTTFPFWKAAAELNVPVCVQMRLPAADDLRTVLERFPDTRVVLDHMAYPPIEDGQEAEAAQTLCSLAGYPNLFLKLTIRNTSLLAKVAAPEQFLEPLLAAFGSSRIAWGSNFPAATEPLDELIATARTVLSRLAAEASADIMHGTAVRLYPRLASTIAG
ncbi:MAG: amidohydrolase [Micromonosporaceae bacterium]|nr:amidohydrolase [Micromonosporaceae bacterium]